MFKVGDKVIIDDKNEVYMNEKIGVIKEIEYKAIFSKTELYHLVRFIDSTGGVWFRTKFLRRLGPPNYFKD